VGKNGGSSSTLVIVAALNEEEGIGPSLAELREVLGNPDYLVDPDYLVVDGNSVDRTVEIAKENGARVMFQEGAGKGHAIAQAIKNVGSGVDYVVFTDADYTYPAKSVPEMIQILDVDPDVGMVTGNRFNHPLELRSIKSLYFVGNRFLAFAQRILNGVNLRDPLTGLRVIRWDILKGWEPRSKGFDIEAEMNHLVERKGYTTVEIPIQYRDRLGQKKLRIRHGFLILKRIVMESLSH